MLGQLKQNGQSMDGQRLGLSKKYNMVDFVTKLRLLREKGIDIGKANELLNKIEAIKEKKKGKTTPSLYRLPASAASQYELQPPSITRSQVASPITERVIPKEPSLARRFTDYTQPQIDKVRAIDIARELPKAIYKTGTKGAGAITGAVGAIVGGFIGLIGQMGKELSTGDKPESGKRIWETGIENAKKTSKFAFSLPESAVKLPVEFAGEVFDIVKSYGSGDQEKIINRMIKSYRGLTSIPGYKVSEEEAKQTLLDSNLAAISAVGYDIFTLALAAMGSSKAAEKLPIKQEHGIAPTEVQLSKITTQPKIIISKKGNSVIIPAEGVAKKTLIEHLKKAKIKNVVPIKEGVEVQLPGTRKLTPAEIITEVNKYPKLKGMFEVKGYEKTKWGKALSDISFKGVEKTGIPGIKYKQPTTGISGRYIPESPTIGAPQPVSQEPIRGLPTVEQRGIVAPEARPQLPTGKGVKPFATPVDSPLVGFQIVNTRQVGVAKGLRTKLQKILKEKEALMKKSPTQALKNQIQNVNNNIAKLNESIKTAKTKSIEVSGPIKKGRPVIVTKGKTRLYTGSNGKVVTVDLDLSNKKIVKLKGDQRNIFKVKTYLEADKILRDKYSKNYDIVKIEHPELPQKANEYFNLKENRWYSEDKEVAKSYALQNRGLKYKIKKPIISGKNIYSDELLKQLDKSNDVLGTVKLKPVVKKTVSKPTAPTVKEKVTVQLKPIVEKLKAKEKKPIGNRLDKDTGGMRGRPPLPPEMRKGKKVARLERFKKASELKKADREKSALIKRRLESEKKAQKEMEENRILEVKEKLTEKKKFQFEVSPVKVYKITLEELAKLKVKKLSKEEIEIVRVKKEERLTEGRVKILQESYKDELLKQKKQGLKEKDFKKMYEKEFDAEVDKEQVFSKADVLFDFLQEEYGFASIKYLLDPVKAVEIVLNKGWQAGLKYIWDKGGVKNLTYSIKNTLQKSNLVNYLGKKAIFEYNLPDWYKGLKRLSESKITKGEVLAQEIMNNLSKGLSKAEKVELHNAIINPNSSASADINARGLVARKIIDDFGERFWKSGAITQETFNKNKGSYLPHLYYGHETKTLLIDWIKRGGVKAELIRAKRRGITKIVSLDRLESWKDKGWEKIADSSYKGHVKIWRDYTAAEREAMGQIIDNPSYVVGKAIKQLSYDTAVLEFFQEVSLHKEYVNEIELPGYKQLPDNEHFGALRGKWIDSYIYEDIKGAVEAKEAGSKLGNQMLAQWKGWKVVWNLPTHFRNIYFNFILSDFAGLSPTRVDIYGSALIDVLKKSTDFKEARDLNVFGGTWSETELNKIIDPETIIGLKSDSKGVYKYNFRAKLGDNITGIINAIIKAHGKTQGKLAALYQGEEVWNKMALYKYAKYDLDLSPTESAKFAKKWGLNYSAVTPAVARFSRKWYGPPFLRFNVLAAPRVVEAVATRPFTLIKWLFIAYAFEEFARKTLNITTEKLKEIKKQYFPEWMKTGVYILSPKLDKNGNPQFLDLTYIIPFIQDIKGMEVYNYLYGNPFFRTPAEIMLNRSQMTGYDLVNDTLNPEMNRRIMFFGSYLYKQIVPPMAPGNYSFTKIWDTMMKKPDYLGNQKDWLTTLGETVFGLKFRSVDLEKEKQKKLRSLNSKYKDVIYAMINLEQNKRLTEAQKKKESLRLSGVAQKYLKEALELAPLDPSINDDYKAMLNNQ